MVVDEERDELESAVRKLCNASLKGERSESLPGFCYITTRYGKTCIHSPLKSSSFTLIVSLLSPFNSNADSVKSNSVISAFALIPSM